MVIPDGYFLAQAGIQYKNVDYYLDKSVTPNLNSSSTMIWMNLVYNDRNQYSRTVEITQTTLKYRFDSNTPSTLYSTSGGWTDRTFVGSDACYSLYIPEGYNNNWLYVRIRPILKRMYHPKEVQEVATMTITENGTHTLALDEGKNVVKSVTVTTNVESSGSSGHSGMTYYTTGSSLNICYCNAQTEWSNSSAVYTTTSYFMNLAFTVDGTAYTREITFTHDGTKWVFSVGTVSQATEVDLVDVLDSSHIFQAYVDGNEIGVRLADEWGGSILYQTIVFTTCTMKHSYTFTYVSSENIYNLSDTYTLSGYVGLPTFKYYACFAEGTQILLADGTTKTIENITYDDVLRTWNFDEGKPDARKPCWIAKEAVAPCYWRIELSNGIILKLVGAKGKSHRLYNATQGKFLYPQDFNTGDITFVEGSEEAVTIVSCEKIYETVKYYNLMTEHDINCFAEGILTGNRFCNIYPIHNMLYVKDIRKLASREDYAEIPDKLFYGLRLAEQPVQDDKPDNVNYYHTMKEHILHNLVEHERDYQGEADYKKWIFKGGDKK